MKASDQRQNLPNMPEMWDYFVGIDIFDKLYGENIF